MDDSGVSDAFYTVLSIAIVMVAALAVSGVVLSTTVKQGNEAGDRVAGFDAAGMERGIYGFYYAVDSDRSDDGSGDPDDVVLSRLALETQDESIDFNSNSAPSLAPAAKGAVIWSGYLYAPSDGDYSFELVSSSPAWLWLDGDLAAGNAPPDLSPSKTFTLPLARGYHPVKLKYFYPDLRSASCTLMWRQGDRMVPAGPFYR